MPLADHSAPVFRTVSSAPSLPKVPESRIAVRCAVRLDRWMRENERFIDDSGCCARIPDRASGPAMPDRDVDVRVSAR